MKELSLKAKIITAAVVTLLLSTVLYFKDGERLIDGGVLKRPDKGVSYVDVTAFVEGTDEGIAMKIPVEQSELSSKEATQAIEKACNELPEQIRGGNRSLSEVKSELKLPALTADGVRVEWFTDDYTLVSFDGAVHNENLAEDVKQEVTLWAELSAGKEKKLISFPLVVLPPERTETQEAEFKLRSAVSETEQSPGEEIHLPLSVDGKKVTYYTTGEESGAFLIMILGLAVCALLFFREKERQKEAYQKYSRLMQEEYPALVNKIAILLASGMSVRMALENVASGGNSDQPAIQTLKNCCIRMANGVSEVEALRLLAEECGQKEYRKLSALLSEYVRKGGRNLLKNLQNEADVYQEERKRLARRRGEEASTRMLLPMMLELGAVMALVMIPAFLTFRGF